MANKDSAPSAPQPPEPAYGDGGYGNPAPNGPMRGLQDYLVILRERKWHILAVFAFVFTLVAIYTFTRTRIYQSTASVQILRRDPTVMQVQAVVDSDVRSLEDLNTVVKVLESSTIVQRVADRLTGEELRNFMLPYQERAEAKSGEPITAAEVLLKNRRIVPQRLSLIIWVQYRHPDRQLAARVANYFVEEFIAHNAGVRVDESMKAVDELKVRAEQQRRKVEELAITIQNYREKHNLVSLDQRKDIVTEKLKALNLYVTQLGAKLKDAEIRWNQVKRNRENGEPLTDLSFIASQPTIAELSQQLAAQKVVVAQLSERYRQKHPKMIEATGSLAQIERELTKAVDSAAAAIEAEYQIAQRNEQEARASLATQENQSLGLDRAAVEYDALERELRINEQLLQHLIGRMRETSMTGTIQTQNARIVDYALPSQPEDFVKPNVLLNLGFGLFAGAGFGLVFALGLAFLDDRVKTVFDVESVVGLPLVGIVPEIPELSLPERAQIAFSKTEPRAAEAFLGIHSALRLRDESKQAKCILISSTMPGEGKSFTVSNLALTFAMHGERVVIVDCDLRKPNIHACFNLPNERGVLDVTSGEASLDQVLVKNVHPRLDVLPAGGRSRNPTQVLTGAAFESMLGMLRQRYDRVFLDTPPLAAVSDALGLLPLVDGTLFTIFFNRARRKAAQTSARRLAETAVPCFGAILNGLNPTAAGYYYAQYYDKSYEEYYVRADENNGTGRLR